ncbi:hypothetical protein [Mycobacteroides abscessus]|uniref:hypothetical protein n=2 Tax=Mycobacteroides abscessus TaxID=36809 RepID=UPI000943E452|nr:hypothetical protein [Mycobacteroides abscessus]RRE01581.1 hypothetical protein D9R13_17240 [Mycobacteroides abscessus subsp. massiliense]
MGSTRETSTKERAMPQDDQWNYEDGVVRGGSICRADDHTTMLDAKARRTLRNLTPVTVRNAKFVAPVCSCGCHPSSQKN